MKDLQTLLYKDWLEFKKKYIQYSLIWFSLPMIYYLFLVIPLSSYLDKASSISGMLYRYWSLPGIWICSSSMFSFCYSFIKLKNIFHQKRYLNRYLKSPITNGQFLFSALFVSIFLGLIQLFISIGISTALNNAIINFYQLLLISLNIIVLIAFFSILGLLFAFYVEDSFFSSIVIFVIFILISFTIGTFIPIDNFPVNFLILIENFPIYQIVLNTQFCYANANINIFPIIMTSLINFILFMIDLY